ncbi:MAG: RICIN domain-containing protein [Lachnospiraceae bacterium]|nr:RICIN domain-containing protein [Lachnospiraceae bacterium]
MRKRLWKSVVSTVLCATFVLGQMTFGQFSFGTSEVQADVTPAVNLISNGDFTDGLSGWSTYFYSSNCATAKVNENYEFDMTVNYWDQWSYDNVSWFKISWQSILIQNVTIQQGKTYTLRFDGYASEDRTIQVGIKDKDAYKGNFNLTTEKRTYSKTFVSQDSMTQELQFLFGYMENEGAINPEGKHDVYISDVYFVEGDGSNIVVAPAITGVEEGGIYQKSVTPSVKYKKDYVATLEYKGKEDTNFKVIDYTVGDEISAQGSYKLTVADKNDPDNRVITSFIVDGDSIDFSKDYYFIKSRSNGKVLEAYGFKENGAIIQTSYKEKISQLYSFEDLGGSQFVIKSLSSGKVVAVNNQNNNGAGIVQQKYTGSNYQKWIKVRAQQGYTTFMNLGSGKVLDIPSASSSEGIQLDQYESNNSNAQMWDAIKVNIDEIVNGKEIPDTSTPDKWKKNAIIAPKEGKLTAAGPIYLTWYNNKAIGNVTSYEIKFDNESAVNVAATNDEIMEYEWYNTSVAKHTVTITAILSNGQRIVSDTRNFFVSKKGIGWGSLYRTDDMNLSWYYQWSMEESAGTSEDLQFVPMVWGNWGSEWLNNHENEKYKQVLGFNEPDFNEQSALSYTDALAAWGDFSNSGLRVGSPCTAIGAYWSKDWFWNFMDGIDADNNLKVDFITIHCYMDDANVDSFLALIDNTWEKWHRPIWITEFGVAKWGEGNDIWNNYTPGANETVYNFMKRVIPELDKRPYVERYAWFPFDPNDAYGGASGIFNYDNGELNELGQLYESLGNPQGYKKGNDGEQTIADGIEINGYQISNSAEGMRCAYSVEDTINGKEVLESGLIYGLSDDIQDSDMFVGSPNGSVYSFKSTAAGLSYESYSESSTADSYLMTLMFAKKNAKEYTTNMSIRAYAKLAGGEYVYTDVEKYTIYGISKYLYDNVKMYTVDAHNYIYNDILKVVTPNYKAVDYRWSNILAPKNYN